MTVLSWHVSLYQWPSVYFHWCSFGTFNFAVPGILIREFLRIHCHYDARLSVCSSSVITRWMNARPITCAYLIGITHRDALHSYKFLLRSYYILILYPHVYNTGHSILLIAIHWYVLMHFVSCLASRYGLSTPWVTSPKECKLPDQTFFVQAWNWNIIVDKCHEAIFYWSILLPSVTRQLSTETCCWKLSSMGDGQCSVS